MWLSIASPLTRSTFARYHSSRRPNIANNVAITRTIILIRRWSRVCKGKLGSTSSSAPILCTKCVGQWRTRGRLACGKATMCCGTCPRRNFASWTSTATTNIGAHSVISRSPAPYRCHACLRLIFNDALLPGVSVDCTSLRSATGRNGSHSHRCDSQMWWESTRCQPRGILSCRSTPTPCHCACALWSVCQSVCMGNVSTPYPIIGKG
jgi:hypothetical protein